MLLCWDDEQYHRLDLVLNLVLVAGIAAFMLAWYFELLPYSMLAITVVPVGVAHWYKRRLEKLFKTYGGAYVTVESKRLVLSKPEQDFEVRIRFRDIQSANSGHWLLLDRLKLSLKDGQKLELVNFSNQNVILEQLNT